MNIIPNGAGYVVNLVYEKDKDIQLKSLGISQLYDH